MGIRGILVICLGVYFYCDIDSCTNRDIEHEKRIHCGASAVHFLTDNFSIHPQSRVEIAFLVTAEL